MFTSPALREPQDLGDQFSFEEDTGALQSILNNQGISHVQTAVMMPSLTPAKRVPNSLKKSANQLEFFETKGGQVFFRRKVLADSGTKSRTQQSSGKKTGLGSNKGRGENQLMPVRLPFSSRKAGLGLTPGKTPMGRENRTPLAPRNNNRMLPPRKPPGTERRPAAVVPPVYRQSISERKPAPHSKPVPLVQSALPLPENQARKSLYNKFGFKNNPAPPPPPAVTKPGAENRPRDIQPSLTKLTRESLRYLPRESLAWLTQLPRESATFAELQRMMTDSDKDLMDDDDTDSFEALESRLRTPYKKRPSPLVEEKNENHDESGIEPINETVTETEAVGEEEVKVEEVVIAPATPLSEPACVGDPMPRTPLVKSVSNSDISVSPPAEVPLARSGSLSNITGVTALSDLVSTDHVNNILDSLEDYQQQLEIFRTEQNKLAEMEAELTRKIRERKDEFKTVWGVSPININTRRTVLVKKKVEVETPAVSPEPDDEPERRVRFNSGGNQTRALTPTALDTPLSSQAKQRRKGRKSFDSLKYSLNFLKTPQTAARQEAKRPVGPVGVPPTPMALRNLSERVMAEFAALYSDSSDDTTDLSDLPDHQVKLNFS